MKLGVRRGRWAWAGAAVLITLAALAIVPSASPEQAASKARRLPAGFLDTGGAQTCTVFDNRTVRCWGSGANGRLGYGNLNDIGDTEAPATVGVVDLGAGRGTIAISSGGSHNCALLDTRQVRCWGLGGNGRLGYGNENDIGDNETPGTAGPVDLGTGRVASAVTAGGAHTCAILDTGQVRCWGAGASGRLGNGNTNDIGDNETPATVVPVNAGGIVSPSVLPTLTLTLKPKRDRKAPFRFGTSGALGGFLVDASTCTGQVTLRARKGKRLVTRKATLKLGAGICSYTAAFRVKSRGKWKVTAAFAGNGSVRARGASARTFRAG